MAIDPGADEAPLPELGLHVWLEGTLHGPLATSVLELDGDLIGLDRPRLGGEPIVLEDGARVRIAYRLKDVPCAVPAVAAEDGGNGGDVAWFRRTGNTQRFQRRGDFRVADSLTARVWPAGEKDEHPAPLVAVTSNLSAGGALLRTVAGLSEHDSASVEIDLPGAPLLLAGRVVRIDDPRTGTGEREVAVRFVDLDPDDEQRLRGHLLERQRVARRRELGHQ